MIEIYLSSAYEPLVLIDEDKQIFQQIIESKKNKDDFVVVGDRLININRIDFIEYKEEGVSNVSHDRCSRRFTSTS